MNAHFFQKISNLCLFRHPKVGLDLFRKIFYISNENFINFLFIPTPNIQIWYYFVNVKNVWTIANYSPWTVNIWWWTINISNFCVITNNIFVLLLLKLKRWREEFSQALTLMLVTHLHLYTWMTWRSWRITFLYIYLLWSHFEKNAFNIK